MVDRRLSRSSGPTIYWYGLPAHSGFYFSKSGIEIGCIPQFQAEVPPPNFGLKPLSSPFGLLPLCRGDFLLKV